MFVNNICGRIPHPLDPGVVPMKWLVPYFLIACQAVSSPLKLIYHESDQQASLKWMIL